MRFKGYDMPGDPPRNYQQEAFFAAHGTAATEVTSEEFYEKLNMLPPIYVPGGFLVCEAVCDSKYGTMHQMYAEIDGRFWAKNVIIGKSYTYIIRSSLIGAYELEGVRE